MLAIAMIAQSRVTIVAARLEGGRDQDAGGAGITPRK
jgi:hypothetical protein